MDKDEKALMDDLMAGLDASMFSSPVKSQAQIQSQRSPVRITGRVERQVSPVKTVKVEKPSPLRPSIAKRPKMPVPKHTTPQVMKRIPKAFVPIKIEVESATPPNAVVLESKADIKPFEEIKLDVRPVLEDDDEFTFDLDLDGLADMDDDLLLKPHVAAKVCFFHMSKLISSCCIRSRTPKYLLRRLDIAQPPGSGVRLNLFSMG